MRAVSQWPSPRTWSISEATFAGVATPANRPFSALKSRKSLYQVPAWYSSFISARPLASKKAMRSFIAARLSSSRNVGS